MRSRQADLMAAWTRSAWGRDDYEMWSAQREVVGRTSPMLPLIEGQLARLDRGARLIPGGAAAAVRPLQRRRNVAPAVL